MGYKYGKLVLQQNSPRGRHLNPKGHGALVGSRIENPTWGRVIRRIGKLVRTAQAEARVGLSVLLASGSRKMFWIIVGALLFVFVGLPLLFGVFIGIGQTIKDIWDHGW